MKNILIIFSVFYLAMLSSAPVLAQEAINREQLTQIFQEGKLSERVELVMANLEKCNTSALAFASLSTNELERISYTISSFW